jgi:hypothetical protein
MAHPPSELIFGVGVFCFGVSRFEMETMNLSDVPRVLQFHVATLSL